MRRRRRLVLAVITAAGVLAAGMTFAPWHPTLSSNQTGDPALAAKVESLVDGPAHHLSVAVVDDGNVRYAGFGADRATEYEIGSISKTFTSALLADAVERGEVALDTTVADILGNVLPADSPDSADSAIAEVTLAELASHRSGLPRLAGGWTLVKTVALGNFLHKDPYTAAPREVIEMAVSSGLDDRGTVQYSNLGAAFLGQLLAKEIGQPYSELVEQRIFEPLSMSQSYVPVTADNLKPDAPTGMTAGGLPAAAWTTNGHAPAGGIRSTAADMAAYARALLDGSAPGAAAMEPRWEADDVGERVGLAWFTTTAGAGNPVTWHNGQTGGFASMIALDRQAGRAVVVLSDVASPVDELAMDLLRAGAGGT
ncbi:serine hydrolase domain-containing protein [Arthrobacter castelli]|uniref:serine hydrolase domain-containing protein n=1 Tax=Arthrobacter castelli TaxID=271431 RepID=UPI000428EBFC|nr:serine hydrolase domain-containing protein [Arthrobacter castelli]